MSDSSAHRPTTDSFMLAGYEFGIDRDATVVELADGRVRSLKVAGQPTVFEQLADDSAFPFDFAADAPVLYAAGVHETAGGQARYVSTEEGREGEQDARPHGAYLDFGGEHDVALAIIAQDGWVLMEGTATLGGKEYGVDVRIGVE